MSIAVHRTASPKTKLPDSEIGFGRIFTDHMFSMRWTTARGWHDAKISAHAPITLDPAAGAFHYGQTMFEGIKAFRTRDGQVNLFAVDQHVERMARGAPRLVMPALDVALARLGIVELVKLDRDWVPSAPGTSLYIRPTLIATESFLGVRPSTEFLFFVIMTPVSPYYGGPHGDGLNPLSIRVERKLTRAAPGGIGATKAGANYAASMLAAEDAKKDGFAQVLWTDALTHKTLEEVGTMNVFMVIEGELVTPPLSDSILGGITRWAILQLAKDLGIRASERTITVEEVQKGRATEAFGCGTASIIAPIGELEIDGKRVKIGSGQAGEITRMLYDALCAVRDGRAPDKHGWLTAC